VINVEPWLSQINWVIQGGESGPTAHEFYIEWAESLISQCKSHRVPYFLKQLGSSVRWKGNQSDYEHSHGGS